MRIVSILSKNTLSGIAKATIWFAPKITMKTRTQLADEHGISRKTFVDLLKRYQIELPKGLIPPEKVVEIYRVLRPPGGFIPPMP